MNDLFGRKEPAAPLADALRPQSLDQVVGQRHPGGLEVVLLLKPGPCVRADGAEYDEPDLDA